MFRVSGLIDAHEPGWPGLSGWLALPRWLLSRYYMKRASPEPPFLHSDWKQCACHFYIEIWSNVHEQCVTRCSGESRGTRLPLIFRLKWGPKGRKIFFKKPGTPLISGSRWPVPRSLQSEPAPAHVIRPLVLQPDFTPSPLILPIFQTPRTHTHTHIFIPLSLYWGSLRTNVIKTNRKTILNRKPSNV